MPSRHPTLAYGATSGVGDTQAASKPTVEPDAIQRLSVIQTISYVSACVQ